MIIGFAVVGRTLQPHDKIPFYAYSELLMLEALADRYPHDQFVVFGRAKNGIVPRPNVETPLADVPNGDYFGAIDVAVEAVTDCEEVVVFWGQHNSVAMAERIPRLDGGGKWVKPLQQPMVHVAPILHALNAWQDADPLVREPIHITNDPRSSIKARDLKWPPRAPILGQWTGQTAVKHYRFADPRPPELLGYRNVTEVENGHWTAVHHYAYAHMELTELLPRLEA